MKPFAPLSKGPRYAPCTCPAYRFPHRRGGGLCRWPEPPLGEHPTPAGTNRPTAVRRRGHRRWLMHYYGLHPIRDGALIARVLPLLYANPDLDLADALAMLNAGTDPPAGK